MRSPISGAEPHGNDTRIRGAFLYGDALDAPWYFRLMRDATDISTHRDRLLFGPAFLGDSGHRTVNVIPAHERRHGGERLQRYPQRRDHRRHHR